VALVLIVCHNLAGSRSVVKRGTFSDGDHKRGLDPICQHDDINLGLVTDLLGWRKNTGREFTVNNLPVFGCSGWIRG